MRIFELICFIGMVYGELESEPIVKGRQGRTLSDPVRSSRILDDNFWDSDSEKLNIEYLPNSPQMISKLVKDVSALNNDKDFDPRKKVFQTPSERSDPINPKAKFSVIEFQNKDVGAKSKISANELRDVNVQAPFGIITLNLSSSLMLPTTFTPQSTPSPQANFETRTGSTTTPLPLTTEEVTTATTQLAPLLTAAPHFLETPKFACPTVQPKIRNLPKTCHLPTFSFQENSICSDSYRSDLTCTHSQTISCSPENRTKCLESSYGNASSFNATSQILCVQLSGFNIQPDGNCVVLDWQPSCIQSVLDFPATATNKVIVRTWTCSCRNGGDLSANSSKVCHKPAKFGSACFKNDDCSDVPNSICSGSVGEPKTCVCASGVVPKLYSSPIPIISARVLSLLPQEVVHELIREESESRFPCGPPNACSRKPCKGDDGTVVCKVIPSVRAEQTIPPGSPYQEVVENVYVAPDAFTCTCLPGSVGKNHSTNERGICCAKGRFPCHDYSHCISLRDLCDGKAQCDDCSDETQWFCGGDLLKKQQECALKNAARSFVPLAPRAILQSRMFDIQPNQFSSRRQPFQRISSWGLVYGPQ